MHRTTEGCYAQTKVESGHCGGNLCGRNVMQLLLSPSVYGCHSGNLGHCFGVYPFKMLTEGIGMKVVLVKSPKFLSGILRLIFGIKKTEG